MQRSATCLVGAHKFDDGIEVKRTTNNAIEQNTATRLKPDESAHSGNPALSRHQANARVAATAAPGSVTTGQLDVKVRWDDIVADPTQQEGSSQMVNPANAFHSDISADQSTLSVLPTTPDVVQEFHDTRRRTVYHPAVAINRFRECFDGDRDVTEVSVECPRRTEELCAPTSAAYPLSGGDSETRHQNIYANYIIKVGRHVTLTP